MTKIIINKNGTIKEKNVKIFHAKMHTNIVFKNDNSFSNIHSYQTNGMTYDIYAKDSGRANNENNMNFLHQSIIHYILAQFVFLNIIMTIIVILQ